MKPNRYRKSIKMAQRRVSSFFKSASLMGKKFIASAQRLTRRMPKMPKIRCGKR